MPSVLTHWASRVTSLLGIVKVPSAWKVCSEPVTSVVFQPVKVQPVRSGSWSETVYSVPCSTLEEPAGTSISSPSTPST